MEITAKSKFDLNTIQASIRLMLFKKADPKKKMIFWTITYLALLAVIILEMILIAPSPILFGLCGILVIVYLLECYWYFLLPRIRYNALKNMKDAENTYIFGEDIIKIFTESQEYNGSAEVTYAMLLSGYETSQFIFLFLSNQQIFAIEKTTITGGTHEKLRSKLMSVVGKKYYFCNY